MPVNNGKMIYCAPAQFNSLTGIDAIQKVERSLSAQNIRLSIIILAPNSQVNFRTQSLVCLNLGGIPMH